MQSRSCFILVCLQLCSFEIYWATAASDELEHRHGHEHLDNEITPEQQSGVGTEPRSQHHLMHECKQHSDYRTYIRCLIREKRQQGGLGHPKNCVDDCVLHNCTYTSSCLYDCHSQCKKRLIETYSKTWETTFECKDGNCTESPRPNVTTNIFIENHQPAPNCTNPPPTTVPPPRPPDCKNGTGTGCSVVVNNVINNQLPPVYPSAFCPCPGCNCQTPQITIGIGGGSGGCMFPSSWPCFQQFPVLAPTIDCTMCSNPFLHFQCHPGCLTSTEKPASSNGPNRRP